MKDANLAGSVAGARAKISSKEDGNTVADAAARDREYKENDIRRYEADKQAESAVAKHTSDREIEELNNDHKKLIQRRRIWTHVGLAIWFGLVAIITTAIQSDYSPWARKVSCMEKIHSTSRTEPGASCGSGAEMPPAKAA